MRKNTEMHSESNGFGDGQSAINIVHKQLVSIRLERGLTQQQVAHEISKLGGTMAVCTLSKIENNRRGINDRELRYLSIVYGVSIDEFFS